MEAELEAAGLDRTVKLFVVIANHAAYALYCFCGFTVGATDTAALYVNGIFHD